MFRLQAPYNVQNDRVIARAKEYISDERLIAERAMFCKQVMVSASVSKMGKTSVCFIELGASMTAQYYRDNILIHMLPEINDITGGDYIFQQGGARPHTANETLMYLRNHCSSLLEPNYWPPNSPDLNVLDYCVWGAIEDKVWQNDVIANIDELKDAIVREWEAFPQESFNRAIGEFRLRMRNVIEADGGHIERYL